MNYFEYWRRLHELTKPVSEEDQGGRSAMIRNLVDMPEYARAVWIDRKPSDPWPEDAPWKADSIWAVAAMHWGGDLEDACNQLMIMEIGKGNYRAVAQWLAAGWTPHATVLRHLAGALSPDDAVVRNDGTKLGVASKKGRKTLIESQVRDIEIYWFVTGRMAAGRGLYESAIEEASDKFNVHKATVRAAYARLLKVYAKK